MSTRSRSGSTRSSSSTWTRTDGRGPVTFTLDLEDHRAPESTEERYPALTRRVLEFLDDRRRARHVLRVGEIADAHPDLVREVADAGHEIGLHGWHHVPLTELDPGQLRADATRGKALLEDLARHAGASASGRPLFSLVPESRWAVDVLAEVGFTYSSSVLPARNPLFGDPRLPATPFRWPNGLVELPCPVRARRRPRPALPRWRVPARAPRRRVGDRGAPPVRQRRRLLWIYCHPYDFDPDEPFWVVPEAGRLGSRLLWYNRRRMFAKIEAMLSGRRGPPLGERSRARPSVCPPTRVA